MGLGLEQLLEELVRGRCPSVPRGGRRRPCWGEARTPPVSTVGDPALTKLREGGPRRELHQPGACSSGQAGRAMGTPGGHQQKRRQPRRPPSPARVTAGSQQPPHMPLPAPSRPARPRAELPPGPAAAPGPLLPQQPWGRTEDAGRRRPAPGNGRCPARAARTWGLRQGLPLFLLPGRSPPAPLGGSAVATEGPLPGDEALDPLDPRGGHPAQPCRPEAAGTGPPAAPVPPRRRPARRHQASEAAPAGLQEPAGGSECRPAQGVRTHAGNTQEEMETGATCCRAARCPGLATPPRTIVPWKQENTTTNSHTHSGVTPSLPKPNRVSQQPCKAVSCKGRCPPSCQTSVLTA